MGWLFSCNHDHDKKACLSELRRPSRFAPGCELLKSSVVGNNHWYLLKCPDGRIDIGLDLMASGYPEHGWGYKDICEEMGPCEVNCPIGFLSLASEPRGYAVEWRKRVVEYHERRKARPKPTPNMVVEYGGHKYRLLNVNWRGARSGWDVLGLEDGRSYRMRAHQLSKAKVIEETNTEGAQA